MTATTTTIDLAAGLERLEADGYADLWSAAPERIAREHAIALQRTEHALCRGVASHSGHRFLNHCLIGGSGPDEEEIEEVRAFYAGLDAEHVVGVPPHVPARVPSDLRRVGYADRSAWAKFHRDVEEPTRRRTALAIVDGALDPEAFGAIFVSAFELDPDLAEWFAQVVGRPRWHTFLALDGPLPVGAASLFVDGELGWFAGGATLAEHRGKGAQGALMAKVATASAGTMAPSLSKRVRPSKMLP